MSEPARETSSEFEHFATLMMSEMHRLNDTMSAGFRDIKGEIRDTKFQIAGIETELRGVNGRLDNLTDRVENIEGFMKEKKVFA